MSKTCKRRKKSTRITCAITLFLLAFSVQVTWAGIMTDPPFLLGDGLYPDIARGPGEQLHVAWMTDSNVYYRLYDGSSWHATETVPMGGYSIVQKSAPDIWADSNNVPHIVWGDDGAHLLYTNRDGGSWGSADAIVTNPDTSAWFFRDVRVAVASDGKRHVIYRRTNRLTDKGEIFHMLWNNGWGAATQISEGTMTSKRPHLTLGSDDALHTVWRQKTGPDGSYEPMYRKWVGGSFQPVIMTTYTIPSTREDTHVAVDPWNNPHISFPEGDDIAYIEWLGGEFSDVEIVGSGLDPVVAIDDAGAKYLFWDDEYSVNIGSGWDAPLTYVANSESPDIIGGSDRVHVVYKNGTMSYYVSLTAGGGPPPPDTTITVSSPNGGENWQVGSTHNIIWNTTGSVDEVDIAYSTDGGGTWTDIVTGYLNQGYYTWLVPNTPSTQCRVRVQDASDGDPSDTSDASFAITDEPQGEQTVTVTSPNGGEWWQIGSENPITWDSSWNFSYVQIDYSTDSGATWIQVTSKTANDGERSWTVPNTPSEGCLVRVRDWEDQDPEDVSNSVFTIGSGPPPDKQLTVITPNGGETLEVGSAYLITWDHEGSISDVAIHYSTNNGTSWNSITNRTANDHERDWTVPDAVSDSCLIRIWEAGTGEGMDLSDSLFSILSELPDASLTLTGPNGGEVLLGGADTPITWQSTGAIDSVQIQYSDDDGSTWYEIAGSYPNTGTFTWTVPVIRSLLAKVKILDLIGGVASDESDSTFIITDDITSPAIDTLYLAGATELVILFTEEVEDSSAELVENYSIDNDISVLSAVLDPGLTSVHLLTTQHLSGITYTVTIEGVRDTANPPNPVAPGTSGEYAYNPSGVGGGSETASIPKSYSLSQNFPNPFNPSTRITFAIPEEEGGSETDGVATRLNIYNLKGQLIKTLFEGYLEPGYHTMTWDGRNSHGIGAGSGVYLYRLEAGSFVVTKKMILVK